jgi:outer membrane protein TolC
MQIFRVIVLVLIGTVFSVSAAYSQELDSLIQQAVVLSPRIKMLEAKRKAAYHKIYQNSNLPDPTLVLGVLNLPTNSFSFNQEPMTQKIVGLKQTFPFPGKLSSIEDAAAIDTNIVQQELKDAINEIRKNVTTKYYNLSYIRKALLYSKESKKLLEQISQVVSTKYTVSSASQQNLIKVQLEITNLSEKIEDLNSKEASLLAELNALFLKDFKSEIQTEYFDDIKYLNLSVNQLDSLSRIYRPFLKGIEFAEMKAQLSQNVAEKDFYPEFNLGLQYSFRDKIAATDTPLNDFFSFVLGISLPLNYGGKVTSKVEEFISMQNFYNDQYNLALQNLYSNFGSTVSQLESLEERVRLFEEGLLPQAQQNFSSALASYQVNEVDFINVIDAQDQLFKIETNLYRLKTDYLVQVAELEFLVGVKFYEQ